jgi:hypothetical protein
LRRARFAPVATRERMDYDAVDRAGQKRPQTIPPPIWTIAETTEQRTSDDRSSLAAVSL